MRALLTRRLIKVGPEDRLADFSDQIAENRARYCVVLDRPRGEFLGVVRIHEAATKPAQRIFADLISEVPACRVTKTEPRQQVLDLLRKKNVEDAVVLSGGGKFVGVATRQSVADWRRSQPETAATEDAGSSEPRLAQRVREKRDQQTDALKQALAHLEEISYAISHDVRAPLRAMRGYALALHEDYGKKLDETANEYLRRIIRASHRVDRLTMGVLRYNEITRTQVTLRKLNLRAILDDAMAANHVEQADAEITVGELIPVRADRGLLLRVLTEFVANALRFKAEGQRAIVDISTERGEKSVYLKVRDRGIGVKPEHRARIFHLFEQIHGAEPFGGLGVGLALVRAAAEKMGGTVGVQPREDGEGSCFWLRLPE